MILRYRLNAPIRALLDSSEGPKVAVWLPGGAFLYESSRPSSTPFEMVGVAWGGRRYFVYPKDLSKKAERVSAA
jgi:hypothetical protein